MIFRMLHPRGPRNVLALGALAVVSLALVAAAGCSPQVIIGTVVESTGSTGGSITTFGVTGMGANGGSGGGISSDSCSGTGTGLGFGTGTITVTNSISLANCGSPAITCDFFGSGCDCTANCPQQVYEARCGLTSADSCMCYESGNLVGSCPQAHPTDGDPYDGCGGDGFGCCAQFFPICG